ncbi:MAG: alpha-ketoglutarate-dependent dioxygenase AlkB [Myxococcales bacterium]|nr:MAG: alpha-ketoglutarate-dependent dioxygenase AlkB [Myxococcales bacterium]
MKSGAQLGLFASAAVALDEAALARATRTVLPGPREDEAWLEHAPGFLRGHEALFEQLRSGVRWRQEKREMYERIVEVPRLYATLPQDGAVPAIVERARTLLGERYGESFERISLGYYRDGADSVAWHGDYVARRMPRALVATLSVGAPRTFLLRPKGGGERVTLSLGWGDLLVMGGSCQRTWEHAVPKVKRAPPRIAIMFRPVWQEPGDSHDY